MGRIKFFNNRILVNSIFHVRTFPKEKTDRMKKWLSGKKILGIPLIAVIVAVVAIVVCATTAVYAAWAYSKVFSGNTVSVKGADIQLFSDSACQNLLPANYSFNFSDIRVGAPSNPIVIYAKNTGVGDAVYLTLKSAGLPAGLQISESTYGAVTTSGVSLFTPPTYTLSSITAKVSDDTVAANATTFKILSDGGIFPASGVLAFTGDNSGSYVSYSTIVDEGSGYYQVSGLTWGVNGTPVVAHTLTSGSLKEITLLTTTPGSALQPGASQAISLTISATDGATLGLNQTGFTLELDGSQRLLNTVDNEA